MKSLYGLQISEIQNEKSILEEKINFLNNLKQELDDTIHKLEQENYSLKNDQTTTIEEIKNYTQKDLESKDEVIRNYSTEIDLLKKKNLEYEEKISLLENEVEKVKERYLNSERKFKHDIINMRDIIGKKDEDLQKTANENERVKYENEKIKLELKSLEQTRNKDEIFLSQIEEMQQKFSEKETKLNEEKTLLTNNYKKELETLNSQLKKASQNNDKETKLIQVENQKMKEEIKFLKDEIDSFKEIKEKAFKLEKNLNELQNNYAVKKIELTQSQMECEKYREEMSRLMQNYKTQDQVQKESISKLEVDLIETKQKLGDVLNELSEHENKTNTSSSREDGKKKGLFSIFSKKKKDKGDENNTTK
jgi:chromosome segregation ATPase